MGLHALVSPTTGVVAHLTTRLGAAVGVPIWPVNDGDHRQKNVHDQLMGYYGLMRNADHLYTPKKRYYAAKQLYRFVKPGAVRVALIAEGAHAAKWATAAFHNPDGSTVIVGAKDGGPRRLELAGVDGKWDVYQTTRDMDFVRTDTVVSSPVQLADESVFTLVQQVNH